MIEFVNKISRTTTTTRRKRTFSYSLLLFYFFLTYSTTAEYDSSDVGSISNDRTQDNDFRSCTEGKCIKRTTQEMSSGMWFGPRLGKRQKFENQREMMMDAELDGLVNVNNALDNSRLDIFGLQGNKKRITGVKLNREEDVGGNDYDEDRIISKLIISEDPRNNEDDSFPKKSFYLPNNRGNGRIIIPWTISSRLSPPFTSHRSSRRLSTMF
ncbi:PREDICTED: PBAN-type neuropeptides-like [Polistes canadensis]|uniref:PBAN-type neuropeptides-like n=1 Tax=Polistes canadensis TaxID=91411 RepID=UPI000718CC53|nr:PREDICTED: PBAN-type neuropeptides-like [Polistes canadensis]